MQIIDGKKLAEALKDRVAREIFDLCGRSTLSNMRPNLAIILVGDREDSKLYVDLKEKQAKTVGIDTHVYRCPSGTSESEALEMIECLNNDPLVDAILIQLPLPEGLDANLIAKAIDPKKDADLFHPENLALLFKAPGREELIPPLIKAVLHILESIKYDLKEKKACIIYNSELFGRSLAKTLEGKKIKAVLAQVKDKDLKEKAAQADILITAAGRPKFIKKEMVKDGAVVIDIGTTRKDGKTIGDVDFENVKEKASYITPVPGGVGPMTIAMLFKNTLELYKKRRK